MNSAKTIVIMAGGPSLTREQVDAAYVSRLRTIVVNSTFRVAPWAEFLYAGDYLWWKLNINDVQRGFEGSRWTCDGPASERWHLNRQRATNRDGLGRECIHMNGNSGVQAINLAYLWGFRKLILLGFDMKLGPNGERHHHPDHAYPLTQHQPFDEWLHKLNRVARDLHDAGVEVINCSPDSAINCFRGGDWRVELQRQLPKVIYETGSDSNPA